MNFQDARCIAMNHAFALALLDMRAEKTSWHQAGAQQGQGAGGSAVHRAELCTTQLPSGRVGESSRKGARGQPWQHGCSSCAALTHRGSCPSSARSSTY